MLNFRVVQKNQKSRRVSCRHIDLILKKEVFKISQALILLWVFATWANNIMFYGYLSFPRSLVKWPFPHLPTRTTNKNTPTNMGFFEALMLLNFCSVNFLAAFRAMRSCRWISWNGNPCRDPTFGTGKDPNVGVSEVTNQAPTTFNSEVFPWNVTFRPQ